MNVELNQALEGLEARFEETESWLRAFMPEPERFARLRHDAAALGTRFPETLPPLFGLMVGVKDVFRVDGLPTTAGSRLPPEVFAGKEAMAVTQLRAAGALIVGKTRTTEFAYFAPGPTCNPHHREHTPGGSSSGSAAAVAAGLCEVALGTQTIGSVGRPASFCGVVGLKPSYDRICRKGLFPLAPSFDHVGIFARSVASAGRVAGVLCEDWRPSAPILAGVGPGPTRPCLAIPTGPFLERARGDGRRHFDEVCARLKARGYDLRAVAAMNDFDRIAENHHLIVAAEAALAHAELFERFGELYAPKSRELVERGRQVTAWQLSRAKDRRSRLRHELEELLARNGCDLFLTPAAIGAAPKGLTSTGDPSLNLPFTQAGMPAIVVPAGQNAAGLPIGIQLVAPFGEDEALLGMASMVEADL
jgi:Asp-tRNA(Asn)/Glu-tRNA(Gln) amidotransferase A subunit family amidase